MEIENKNLGADETINKQSDLPGNTDEDQDEHKWCFAWFANKPHAKDQNERAALLKDTKWPQGSIITISFLDGHPEVWERVKKAAMQWVAPGMANLTFAFRKDTTKTDIRITFKYAGSWSVLGTTCKTADPAQATMNFGWLNKSSTDDEVNRVVLHEFGHALGLTHEHMNPGGVIPWNREQVIKDLSAPPNNWPLETIESNMFKTYEKKETNFTALDPVSIMMYPIPKAWTTNGFTVDLNTKLSETDKNFIRQQYP